MIVSVTTLKIYLHHLPRYTLNKDQKLRTIKKISDALRSEKILYYNLNLYRNSLLFTHTLWHFVWPAESHFTLFYTCETENCLSTSSRLGNEEETSLVRHLKILIFDYFLILFFTNLLYLISLVDLKYLFRYVKF